MTRFTMKILVALVAVGCGTSAMASPTEPTQGYWAGYYDNSHQTSPDQSQPATQPSRVQPAQGTQPPDAWDDQSQSPSSQQPQPVQPSQPSQGPAQPPQNQNPWDQDQEEDSAETFSWSTGQSHLGVMVMSLTPELRLHFGAPSNVGVLIAKVEPNSAASRAGILVGDVLVRVGRLQIHTGDDVIQALAAQGGGRIMLLVIRQGQRIQLGATIPGHPPQQQPPQQQPPQQQPPQQQPPQQQPPQQQPPQQQPPRSSGSAI